MEIIGVELHTCIIVTDMEGKYQDIQTAHGLWYTPVEMILPGPTSRGSFTLILHAERRRRSNTYQYYSL
jgi:hypothetical protein